MSVTRLSIGPVQARREIIGFGPVNVGSMPRSILWRSMPLVVLALLPLLFFVALLVDRFVARSDWRRSYTRVAGTN